MLTLNCFNTTSNFILISWEVFKKRKLTGIHQDRMWLPQWLDLKKKRSHMQKLHPKWWTPQIQLGNAAKEEKAKRFYSSHSLWPSAKAIESVIKWCRSMVPISTFEKVWLKRLSKFLPRKTDGRTTADQVNAIDYIELDPNITHMDDKKVVFISRVPDQNGISQACYKVKISRVPDHDI